jgi:hypothetical protein
MHSGNKLSADADVVKKFLTDASHKQFDLVIKVEEKLTGIAEKELARVSQENQKTAEKKKKGNQEFSFALDLACIIKEIKLIIYYQTIITEMIKSFHEKLDIQAIQTKLQRYTDKLENPSNPLPIQMPGSKESASEYQEKIIAEAKQALEIIQDKQTELASRMIASWGSTDWAEGLKIQTAAIHKKEYDNIEKLEFLEVILQPDGSKIDPEDVAPEVSQIARVEMHKVNDDLENFLNNWEDRSPVLTDPDPDYDGGRGPAFEAEVGENVPQAPAVDGSEMKLRVQFNIRSQLDIDTELFLINKARDAFKNIGEPLIHPVESAAGQDAGAVVDKNSALRIAVRYSGHISEEIHALEEKANAFKLDKQAANKLENRGVALVSKIHEMELKAGMQEQRPERRIR